MHRSHRSAPTIETPRAKVTVTRRPDSLAYADRKARERGVSRSEIIDAALAEAADREVSPIGQLSAERECRKGQEARDLLRKSLAS